jgi:hypothetical protein
VHIKKLGNNKVGKKSSTPNIPNNTLFEIGGVEL